MADEMQASQAEAARARVRRLFIEPLVKDGMRFKHGTSEEDRRRKYAQMADDLAYLSDASLTVLAQCMRTKGEGSARVFWPSRVSLLGFAEAREPRPIEEIPGLKSWFVSAAGRAAAEVPGRLVAEFGFWRRHKRPPVRDVERSEIDRRAEDYARRAQLTEEREQRGVHVTPEDRRWLGRFRETEAMLKGWLAEKEKAA